MPGGLRVTVGLLLAAALAGLPVTGAAEVLRASGAGTAIGSIRALIPGFEQRNHVVRAVTA